MRKVIPYAVIILICFLLYFPSLFFNFTYLDDSLLILKNINFLREVSNIPVAFTQDVFHVLHQSDIAYRPILIISLILDTQWNIFSLFSYHLTNILIHVIAACLVFALLKALKHKKMPAFFFSLVFAVHPMLAQAVAWIPGRNDSLLGLFLIVAFLAFLRFVETERVIFYIFHIIFLALALFTKETSFMLPFLCIVYLFLVGRGRMSSKDEKRLILAWILILLIWYIFRENALSHQPISLNLLDIGKYLFKGLPALFLYFGKAVFPFNLSLIPIMEDSSVVYGILLSAAVGVVLSLSKYKRYNFIFFGLLWFALFLLPSFIQPSRGHQFIFFEHRAYIPMIGIFILLLEIDFLKNLDFKRKKVIFSCIVVLIVFSGLNIRHSSSFSDGFTFWEKAEEKSPHSSFVHGNLGFLYYQINQLDAAEGELKKALAINPDELYAHHTLGCVYARKGLSREAEIEYKKEIVLQPDFGEVYFNLAGLYYREGRVAEARRLWKKTLECNSDNIIVLRNLAILSYERKNYKEALYYFSALKNKGEYVPDKVLDELMGYDK